VVSHYDLNFHDIYLKMLNQGKDRKLQGWCYLDRFVRECLSDKVTFELRHENVGAELWRKFFKLKEQQI